VRDRGATKKTAAVANSKTFTFTWDKASFRVRSLPEPSRSTRATTRARSARVLQAEQTRVERGVRIDGVKVFTYFITQYGLAPSSRLKIVEIPDDTVPTAYAPRSRP